jgi:hypothetical protein
VEMEDLRRVKRKISGICFLKEMGELKLLLLEKRKKKR